MNAAVRITPVKWLKRLLVGRARSPHDHGVYHKLSLVAFFAWVGLGADGLSSTCYGPEEAFRILQGHLYLGFFVALATVLTVIVISASYSQIVEQFPGGGGGYQVASKMLSPSAGTVSGCALMVDYVLTVALSIASGADAIFSMLPPSWQPLKLWCAVGGVMLLTLLNLRGVKESVVPLIPIFLTFLATHLFVILYALLAHIPMWDDVYRATAADFHQTRAELGLLGVTLLLMRAYSMGAGTYTGIEAVANAIPILREPRVQTAKLTMKYMAASLAITAMGVMLAYIFYQVAHDPAKTLNAVLLSKATAAWAPGWSRLFILVTLVSEAALLFVAAQAGFIGGPRVLANMAMDRWVPTHFATLSDRLVTSRGILLMGTAALAMIVLSGGSVQYLVVFYSITVFIDFTLSQLGMIRHWWQQRRAENRWLGKMLVNGTGLTLTLFILCSVVFLKFDEGGWVTLFVTALLVAAVHAIRRYYRHTTTLLKHLEDLVPVAAESAAEALPGTVSERKQEAVFDPSAKTAVILVNGFNGLGLHTLFTVLRLFAPSFKNFVFVQVGAVDAGNFKGINEVGRLREHVQGELARYVQYMRKQGFFADSAWAVGIDVVDEIEKLAPGIVKEYPNSVFFGGQLAFVRETVWSRWLHNNIVFAAQRRLHAHGIPFVILPIQV